MTGGARRAGAPFLDRLRSRAAARRRRLVFPEGGDPRVLEAVAEAARDGLFESVVLGDPDEVWTGLARAGLGDAGGVFVLDPAEPARVAWCAEVLQEVERGRTASAGRPLLPADALTQAAALVRTGEAHGGVAGAVRTTAEVVRSALRLIGVHASGGPISSAFYMVFGESHAIGPGVLTFTDAGVLPEPTAEELARTARSAALAHADVVDEEPRVAFLSYSTRGSAEGRTVTLAREALRAFEGIAPGIAADGELQGDAALVPEVALRKAPGSAVGGRANVLVFPDLAAANIAYKLVQHLGGAQALGPVLHGLDRPFNDLSRGCTADDIVAVGCITALMGGPGTSGSRGPGAEE